MCRGGLARIVDLTIGRLSPSETSRRSSGLSLLTLTVRGPVDQRARGAPVLLQPDARHQRDTRPSGLERRASTDSGAGRAHRRARWDRRPGGQSPRGPVTRPARRKRTGISATGRQRTPETACSEGGARPGSASRRSGLGERSAGKAGDPRLDRAILACLMSEATRTTARPPRCARSATTHQVEGRSHPRGTTVHGRKIGCTMRTAIPGVAAPSTTDSSARVTSGGSTRGLPPRSRAPENALAADTIMRRVVTPGPRLPCFPQRVRPARPELARPPGSRPAIRSRLPPCAARPSRRANPARTRSRQSVGGAWRANDERARANTTVRVCAISCERTGRTIAPFGSKGTFWTAFLRSLETPQLRAGDPPARSARAQAVQVLLHSRIPRPRPAPSHPSTRAPIRVRGSVRPQVLWHQRIEIPVIPSGGIPRASPFARAIFVRVLRPPAAR